MSRHSVATSLVVAAALLALTGCGDDSETVTVYAASSLTAGFEQLADDFESTHDGVEVRLTFGGSSDLAAQIDQGAPADVFASADEPTMAGLVGADLVDEPRRFAANTLQIAVPPDNPAGIASLDDLTGSGVQLVVCAPAVPCGDATARLARQEGVDLSPVSEEQSVTDVLTKVTTGEADAGLVYVTDVAAAGDDVRGIDVPGAERILNSYPIATVVGSKESDLGQEFVDLVLSDQGQQVLAELGFAAP